MRPRLPLKTLKKLAGIFLTVSLLACNRMPLVTVNQLDTRNNLVNPFKIVKYDMQKCVVMTEDQPSFPILGPEMHGAYCLTKEDFAKFKKYLQTECKNQNEAPRSTAQ